MPNQPAVHVRRYAYYEEFVIRGDLQQPGFLPAPASRRSYGFLPHVMRAAMAVGVTVLPLVAARLAGARAKPALGPARRSVLPLPAGQRQ